MIFVFHNSTNKTSGFFFFSDLSKAINTIHGETADSAKYLLFNVNCSIFSLLYWKYIRGKLIVLRCDGLYFDKFDFYLFQRLNNRRLLFAKILNKLPFSDVFKAEVYNFYDHNYKHFSKIFLSDLVVYQSTFSKYLHQRYFPYKKSFVCVNGSNNFLSTPRHLYPSDDDNLIKLVTVFNGYKASKRLRDLFEFILNTSLNINLTVLGFDENNSPCLPSTLLDQVKNSQLFTLKPKFESYDTKVSNIFHQSHAFMSFTVDDPCPNIIVEALAHGLPVIAPYSGGIPDIVGDSDLLFDCHAPSDYFRSSRYSYDFPIIDYNQVDEKVRLLMSNYSLYASQARKRFSKYLSLEVVANYYSHQILSIFS